MSLLHKLFNYSIYGFRIGSVRDKHYEYCSINCQVNVKMPPEIKTLLKVHNNQYQFKVSFMLSTGFERIFLDPVDETFREKIDQVKTG